MNLLPQPTKIRDQIWPESVEPVLSICCWTFNDAKYIRECIESFLVQETTFPVEIVIQDDASSDGTTQIIEEYGHKYPKLFNNSIHKTNQHSIGGNITLSLLERPRGQYVALCHGDDYWTRSDKLAIQVDFLNVHPEYAGVFHRGYAINEAGDRMPFVWDSQPYKTEYSQHDCIFELQSGYPTAALMFSKKHLPLTIPFYMKNASSDYCLDIMLTENAPLAFLDFEGSAYRQGSGNWSTLTQTQMQNSMLKRLIALYRDGELRWKYPELKELVHRQLDAAWWQAYQNSLYSWFGATLSSSRFALGIGPHEMLQWLMRPTSPPRYKLRDIILKR